MIIKYDMQMKRIIFYIIVLILTSTYTVAANEPKQMTMTTSKLGEVWIGLEGSGTATIDWGDGTPTETITLSDSLAAYGHNYSNTIARTISITGKNITRLECSFNQLTSLDVSRNTTLKQLGCSFNQLTSLNINRNTELAFLSCLHNLLTSLDISRNTELISLSCGNNLLTSLNISNNIVLVGLFCGFNQLTDLDVSRNIKLDALYCNNNQLTILDVSKNTALIWFYCDSNQLTNLDVCNNTALDRLVCNSNLLSSDALNALFETLHNNTTLGLVQPKTVRINDNPGTAACNQSIATAKGWTVRTE